MIGKFIFLSFMSSGSAIGILVAILGVMNLMDAKRSERWATVEGEITYSEVYVERDENGKEIYYADVEYIYDYRGDEFTGTKVTFDDSGEGMERDIKNLIDQFPVGETVTVYYDRENPRHAILIPGIQPSSYFALIFGLAFFVFGLPFATLGWWSVLREPKPKAGTSESPAS